MSPGKCGKSCATIFTALQRRASDIHIETRDDSVVIKFRIDGALYAKVDPIDIAFHQTLISRIKVMSELDIAERIAGARDALLRLDLADRLFDRCDRLSGGQLQRVCGIVSEQVGRC